MARAGSTSKGGKRKPARKRPPARRGRGGKGLQVEQHHRDLVGLGLIAFGAFLAVVLYGGETGGRAGEAVTDALRFLLGGVAYLAPIGFVAAGVLLVVDDLLPTLKPFRAGAICLVLGLALGLAAGSLGLGPGAAPHEPLLQSAYVSERGGVLGETLYWASSTLFSTIGSHIVFVFLMVGGILLLTGASLAGILRTTGAGVATTTRAVRNSTSDLTAVLSGDRGPLSYAARRAESGDVAAAATAAGPPEPPGVEPVVHATHVEAPALDAEDRFPDLFADGGAPEASAAAAPEAEPDWAADDDEPFEAAEGVEAVAAADEPGADEGDTADLPAVEAEPVQEELTPMGNRRTDGVTEADDVDYVLPTDKLPQALAGRAQGRPGRDRQGRRPARRGARPLRRRGEGRRHGQRPARHPLRAAPGARDQDVEGLEHARRPRLRARRRPTSASSRRSPASAPSASRSRTRSARWSISATSTQKPPEGWSPLTVWLGKDIDGQRDRHRPRQAAARAGRGHHRRRQVGLRQRDAVPRS